MGEELNNLKQSITRNHFCTFSSAHWSIMSLDEKHSSTFAPLHFHLFYSGCKNIWPSQTPVIKEACHIDCFFLFNQRRQNVQLCKNIYSIPKLKGIMKLSNILLVATQSIYLCVMTTFGVCMVRWLTWQWKTMTSELSLGLVRLVLGQSAQALPLSLLEDPHSVIDMYASYTLPCRASTRGVYMSRQMGHR